MGTKNIAHVFFAVISLFAMLSTAQAEEFPPDKFKLSFGGYAIVRFDSSISLTEPNLGAGISISPQDTLGLDIDNTVLRIEGYYRLHPRHALTYSWYSISSDGRKTVEEAFEWVDEDGNTIIIPLNAQVISTLDYDIFKVGYLWSFHHTDKVELGVGAGLHITRLALGLDASTTTPANRSVENVDTTVPLPVISFVLRYNVTPKFLWYMKTEAFALKFDKWAGSYRDATFGMEYRAWKNVALGVGLSSNSLEIEEDDPKHQLRFDNTISGGLLYIATYF
ncbi:MAG: hypothetical protein HKM94_02065 [Halobacteria archaeon]|nr:hypothetical protein [Halobacteria archaeon]